MIKHMVIAFSLVMSGVAVAAPSAANSNVSTKKAQDMNFEDLLVSGQYHFSDEAVTTVEEDKVLNSLIGVRSDFKDRMKQSATLGEVKE